MITRQAAHRERELAAGGARKTFQFRADEAAMLERLSERYGGDKPAVVAALRLLDGREDISADAVIDWIRRRAK